MEWVQREFETSTKSREEALKRVHEIKINADREQEHFEKEWHELSKLIEADNKMGELLGKSNKS